MLWVSSLRFIILMLNFCFYVNYHDGILSLLKSIMTGQVVTRNFNIANVTPSDAVKF